jgi:hypothetical protein
MDLSKFLNASKKPKTVTYPYEGKLVFYGIYEVKGDELRVCGDGVDTATEKNPETRRPKEFDSNKGLLLVFKRDRKTELRWQFKKGEKLRYTIDENMGIKMKTRDKGAFVMSQQLVLDTTWIVERVDKSGKAALSVTIDRIRFQADGNADAMEVKMKYDSKEGKEPKEQAEKSVAQMFQAMVGRPITLDMNRLGEVSNVTIDEKTTAALQTDIGRELSGFFGDTFAAEGVKRRLSEAMVILPKKALARGDSWKQSAAADIAKPSAVYVRTYTYRGSEIKDRRELARIDVKAALVPQGEKGQKIKVQRGQGVIYFDKHARRLARSEISFKLLFDDEFLIQSEHEWTMRVEHQPK